MWSLKYDTTELVYKTETQRHRGQTCGWQGGGAKGGIDWEFGISRCKLLHTE